MCVLLARLFVLQIVRGEDYQENYNLKVEKVEMIPSTRGNIYDRNGYLLAYNELSYAVTIEDSGNYSGRRDRNKRLNDELYFLISNLEACGDGIDNDFGVTYSPDTGYEFVSSGTALLRFKADVFGHASINDLTYNSTIGANEADATASQLMEYLCGSDRYDIPTEYDERLRYEIAVVRYNMGLNSYQKYIATTIASDINEMSLAFVEENLSELTGVDVEEQTIRTYNDAEAFSNIIGYTGKISTEEYEEFSKESDDYSLTDMVGKVGIEQYMNSYLAGKKGERTVYVDSVGNLIEVTNEKKPESGGHVYLSIDRDLQVATYQLLEEEIAGIVYNKIVNTKEYRSGENSSASDVVIPIYSVYNALISNNLISRTHFKDRNASDTEKAVYESFLAKREEVFEELRDYFTTADPVIYKELPEEYQDYTTYIVKKLRSDEILGSADTTDEYQQKWVKEELSAQEYLIHAIEINAIDITKITDSGQYIDTDEVYAALVEYIMSSLMTDDSFEKSLYHYAILQDEITGRELSLILFDQGILSYDENAVEALENGSVTAYSFIRDKIKHLEIKPGDLALDPCSGSAVVLDINTGEVLACVSYPGYDNNRLAHADNAYFAYLNLNQANPLYNHATQQRTAPGSTFKLCSSTAGMAEGVIDTSSKIEDLGKFDKVSNEPTCWIYPSSHGEITVSEAIRDSCNYFFYEVGYRLAGSTAYNDKRGIERLTKYASEYGLDDKTGVEIEENSSTLATEYPVMAAIGQSNHNITTIALARYVCAVANHGTVYDLTLLDHLEDSEGELMEEYSPTVRNEIEDLSPYEWNAINTGMRMVVENMSEFDEFPLSIAGKTGTAQEVTNRPNHALFVGYAPYESPKIAIATRIPYGYTSHNAADISKNILGVYYNVESSKALLNNEAITGVSTQTRVTD